MLQAIVAISDDGFIGTEDGAGLPWKLSPDMKRFKALTMGHAVIMGRKTFDTIGKALPGRTNIVVSRSMHRLPETVEGDIVLAGSPLQAVEIASGDPNPFVIGGAEIYTALWPQVERVHLTRVHRTIGKGVAFDFDASSFREVDRSQHLSDDGWTYSFIALERAS